MNEVLSKMIKHPFRTAIVIGAITSGVVGVIRAIKDVKLAGKAKDE